MTLVLSGEIVEGREDDFVALAKRAMELTPEGVDGCISYKLHLSSDRRRMMLFEQWADGGSVDRHLAILVAELGDPPPGKLLPAAWEECMVSFDAEVWDYLGE